MRPMPALRPRSAGIFFGASCALTQPPRMRILACARRYGPDLSCDGSLPSGPAPNARRVETQTMKPELTLLVWSVALAFLQVVAVAHGATMQVGLPMLAGNRDNVPALTGWVGRAQRAHHNMIENLVLFAVLVLVAVVAGKTNATTLLGAEIFFWSRVVYAAVYYAGIPWLRTGVWGVSVVGMVMIFLQLL